MLFECMFQYRNVSLMADVRPPKNYESNLQELQVLFVILHSHDFLPLFWIASQICSIMLEVMKLNLTWVTVTVKAKPFAGIILVQSKKTAAAVVSMYESFHLIFWPRNV